MGNDTTITIAGAQGQFELNVRVPLVAAACSTRSSSSPPPPARSTKCVSGVEPNEMLERHARATLATATALNPHIGYDRAAEIVKEAAFGAHPPRGGARAGGGGGHPGRGPRPPKAGAPARLELERQARNPRVAVWRCKWVEGGEVRIARQTIFTLAAVVAIGAWSAPAFASLREHPGGDTLLVEGAKGGAGKGSAGKEVNNCLVAFEASPTSA